MTKDQLKYGRHLAEKYYDIKFWRNDNTAVVHYWDDNNGDFYLDETLYDLISTIAFEHDDVYEFVEHIY